MAEDERQMCGWCGLIPGAYRDDDHGRVCRRCYAYRYKYDRLPPPTVIHKRVDRMVRSHR